MDVAYMGCTFPIDFGPVRWPSGDVVQLAEGTTITCKAVKEGEPESAEVSAVAMVVNSTLGLARAEFSSVQTRQFTESAIYHYDAIADLPSGKRVYLGGGDFTTAKPVAVD